MEKLNKLLNDNLINKERIRKNITKIISNTPKNKKRIINREKVIIFLTIFLLIAFAIFLIVLKFK